MGLMGGGSASAPDVQNVSAWRDALSPLQRPGLATVSLAFGANPGDTLSLECSPCWIQAFPAT